MISLNTTDRIFLYSRPVDFRKQINSLMAVVQNILCEDPLSGAYFIFTNRYCDSLKILHYDGQGMWLHQKRLSRGKFKYFCCQKGFGLVDKNNKVDCRANDINDNNLVSIIDNSAKSASKMSFQEALVLLMNGNPQGADFQVPWKKVI